MNITMGKTTRICFVGDSLTVGTNDAEFLGWPGRICQRETSRGHEVSLYNLGIRAETSSQIRPRWRAECTPRLPDEFDGRLVMSFGVNDSVEQADGTLRVSFDESMENARAMIAEAKAWKPVLWISPLPTPDLRQPFQPSPEIFYSFDTTRCARLSEGFKDIANELSVPYLDVFIQQEEGDGVHPTANGYAMVADRVEAWDAWRAWWDD